MAKKNFTAGSVLRAADVNEYLTSSNNVVINGAFDFWQRGTSFSNPATGLYTADRWRIDYNGTGATRVVSRVAFTAGEAPDTEIQGQYYLRHNVTVAGSSNTLNILSTKIEDVRTLAGQNATISFWAKCSSTQTIQVDFIQDFGSGGSVSYDSPNTSFSVTNAWTRFTATIALPSLTGKTIGAESYLHVRLFLPSGVTASTDIWGVQVEAGSTATPFSRSSITLAGELAACQRYCQIIDTWNGIGEGTTSIAAVFPFHTEMRIAPTVTAALTSNQLSLRTAAAGDYDLTGWGATAPTVSSRGMWVLLTGMTGLIDNQAYTMRFIGTGKDGLFRVEAEL